MLAAGLIAARARYWANLRNERDDPGENQSAHVKFFNGQRGYARCDVNPKRWQADYRVIAAVTKPDEPVSTRASFVVESGKPWTVSA